MQGNNKPGKLIRKIRSRGIASKERVRRIDRLIERQFISCRSEIPSHSIPVDSDKVFLDWSGKLAKVHYVDLNFVCKDCGVMQTWFKEDQMWFYEETNAHFDQTAVRCGECRTRERERIAAARKAAGHEQ